MHNPALILENDTHKLLWDFDLHTGHLILARRPDLKMINKKREFAKLSTLLSQQYMLHIDLRPGQAVKKRNAPV